MLFDSSQCKFNNFIIFNYEQLEIFRIEVVHWIVCQN